ncbi:monofunctional biosynthetic peptidoglycan transglycosylase [Spectribacter hydrogenooxidans]|uniref:Biosynthetic peptidoglycan transglycosylase n=1 Tax=Spectribacter hydrogenoxidans TaxID=3075608 RepID=A0ABU3C2G3_9GAMM|nr:monofunctional biosynthetic peptidoglycan transglycosylase [Salinisphaera sp. W335]MDT0635727.1 monofunctional biosynthetic peptidoglycan transglycosylase [Salinisphaera sp. W335]
MIRGLGRRLRRWLLTGLLVALAAPALAVLLLRWVDPPTSAFMLQAQWQQSGAATGIDQRWADLADIAPALPLAVVAAEDQTFPDHHGFVWDAIGEALENNLAGGNMRGASSITQQVAKNLFLTPSRSYLRKAVEAYITVWIEWLWPKRRILEVYLNIAQFGDSVFGAEAAARRFFGVGAAGLSAGQAALLAGVLPDPRDLDAASPGPYLLERQRWIHSQMRQLGPGYLGPILAR